MTDKHFSQKPRRKAEFIKPPNMLKTKVGTGGLSDDILNKAEDLLENNTVDFQPLAEMYLAGLMKGIELAKEADPADDQEYVISRMLYPGMQLKANGGMFHYPLVTRIADKLIQFLEGHRDRRYRSGRNRHGISHHDPRGGHGPRFRRWRQTWHGIDAGAE
jgi:hypothetical protein